jgi:hypothetical protein
MTKRRDRRSKSKVKAYLKFSCSGKKPIGCYRYLHLKKSSLSIAWEDSCCSFSVLIRVISVEVFTAVDCNALEEDEP